MSDPKNQEPSMEEILASIRRIIAEDAEAAPPQAEATPEVPAAPEPPRRCPSDVVEAAAGGETPP